MYRSLVVSTFCATALALPLAHAQNSSAAPTAKASKAKHKSAQSRAAMKSEPTDAALASDTAALTPQQMDIASRVLIGRADCEFSQQVEVQPAEGKPGYFRVSFKNAHYEMVPEETTTGAVRLQDKRQGMMWLQIPSKSMLMNSKIGQRMVDSCMVASQKTASEAPAKPAVMLGSVAGAR